MCDERERLIGYLYGECDADERAEIDRHVSGCPTCRDEIAGLNATRQDLLAWEVPDHVSVWKPFAPARLTPWWREVPAWALAAAAGVMFLIGVSGGVVAQAMFPRPAAATTAAIVTPAPANVVAASDAVSRAELDKLAQDIRLNLSRLDASFQRVSETTVRPVQASSHEADDLRWYTSVFRDISTLRDRVNALQQQNEALQRVVVSMQGQPAR